MENSTISVRSEVFGAVMPHEAAASFLEQDGFTHADSHATLERLTVSDAFTVVRELGKEGVSYPRWVATVWAVLGWPEPSARVFFEVVWLVSQELRNIYEMPTRICAAAALEAKLDAVDLGLFLLLHGRHDAIALSETKFEEPWIENCASEISQGDRETQHMHDSSPPASPPTSPRGNSRGIQKRASLELCLRARAAAEASRKHWIVGRAESLLRLAARAEENGPFFVSVSDVNRLMFLFRGSTTPLSDCCPLFQKSNKMKTIQGQRVAAWLANAVQEETPPLFADFISGRNANSTPLTPPHATSSLSHTRSYTSTIIGGQPITIIDARKCTRLVIQQKDDYQEADTLSDCRIINCRDTRIYILAATRNVEIIGSSDCLIVVGAARCFARLVACERTHVVTAAGRILLSSCLSCRLSVFTPFAPLLDGDNRGCRLAPFCAVYDGILNHLHMAGLLSKFDDDRIRATSIDEDNEDDDRSHRSNLSDELLLESRGGGHHRRSRPHHHNQDFNLWRSPLRLASSVHRGCNFARAPLSSESLALHPNDFELVATQFLSPHKKQTLPFPLPAEYAAAIHDRQSTAEGVRRKLYNDERLDPNARAVLQANARAAFTKWLIDTRAIRHVSGPLHLESPSLGLDSRGSHSPSSFTTPGHGDHSNGQLFSTSSHRPLSPGQQEDSSSSCS